MQYYVILPGAGSSTRFQKDKLTIKINGEYLINHTISNFVEDQDCKKIVLVVNTNKYDFYKNLYCLNKKILVVKANTLNRQESVQIGLNYCLKSPYVLVHDACRPYLNMDLIEQVKIGLTTYDAVCPIVDMIDSVIQVENHNIQYLNREHIKCVQTPQGFKTTILLRAFDNNKDRQIFNDELSLVLATQSDVNYLLISGKRSNKKITNPEDVNFWEYDEIN